MFGQQGQVAGDTLPSLSVAELAQLPRTPLEEEQVVGRYERLAVR